MTANAPADIDVVVIGAGNAGCVAALSAAEQGARVLMLEVAPEALRGGNSAFTGGAFRFAYEGVDDLLALAPEMSETELESIDFGTYTESQYFDDMARMSQYRSDLDLTALLVGSSYETARWMYEQGVRFQPAVGRQAFKVDGKSRFWGGLALHVNGGGQQLIETLYNAATAAGRTVGIAIDKTNWANRLDEPPFEAYAVTAGVTFTFGGLKVTTSAQVEDTAGNPIPGLYACGEIVGGLYYHNYASTVRERQERARAGGGPGAVGDAREASAGGQPMMAQSGRRHRARECESGTLSLSAASRRGECAEAVPTAVHAAGAVRGDRGHVPHGGAGLAGLPGLGRDSRRGPVQSRRRGSGLHCVLRRPWRRTACCDRRSR